MAVYVIMNSGLQAGGFRFQKVEMLLEGLRNRRGDRDDLGFFWSVLFPTPVRLDRVQPGDQGLQFTNLDGRGLPARRFHQRTLAGQHLAIAGIGLGADGQALAEGFSLGRIDDGDRRTRWKKPQGHGFVIDPRGFQNQMNLTSIRDFLADQPIP